MISKRMRGVLSAAVAAALLLTACGGEDGAGEAVGDDTTDAEPADDVEEEPTGDPDQVFEFRFNAYGPADSDETQNIRDFAEEVASLTGGGVTIEVFDSGALMDQATAQTALARGELEMTISNAAWVGDQVPAVTVLSVPYMIQSVEHRQAVLASEFGQELFERVAEETGIRPLASLYLGTRNLNLSADVGRIETPDDLAGLNIRMPDAESWIRMGTAMGFNPTPIAINELYLALQTGTVVGQDNPVIGTIDFGFYEVTGQYVLTQHLVDDTWYAISEQVWQELSAEYQDALLTAAQNASERQAELYVRKEAEGLDFLRDQGLDVYEPDVEAFREHVLSSYLEDESVTSQWPDDAVEIIQSLAE
jgi:TRAP-type transport system periplasmic protein